jgi:rhodanese-related sulfurtransferase
VVDETVPETQVPPERAAELIEAGAQVIDVRRASEWDGGRIAGARNIEMNELTAAADSIERGRVVLFYCRGGGRSSMAAEAFREAGFEAYSVTGGLEAWAAGGRPLEPEDGEVRVPPPPS